MIFEDRNPPGVIRRQLDRVYTDRPRRDVAAGRVGRASGGDAGMIAAPRAGEDDEWNNDHGFPSQPRHNVICARLRVLQTTTDAPARNMR